MNKRLIFWIIVGVLVAFTGGVLIKKISGSVPALTVEETGPQVVGQSPADGQWLDLNSPIQITFDRDIDQTESGDAFSVLNADLEPVSGEISWDDARTLSFTPNSNWVPSSEYQFMISTQLTDVDGGARRKNIRLRFFTIDKLGVTDFFPIDGASSVDVGSAITVVFNHPIVPLTVPSNQGNLPQPVVITPEVEGKGEWISSSVYVFEPREGLKSGTSYKVRVEAGLDDVSGNPMEDSYQSEFSTQAPAVQSVFMKNGYWMDRNARLDHIRLNQPVVIDFDSSLPMDQKSVERATTITNIETGAEFPVDFAWNEAGTEVTVTPSKLYTIGSFYRLTVDASAAAQDGGHLESEWSSSFSTMPLPSVKSTFPAAGSKSGDFSAYLTINFASEMDLDSVESRIQITPALEDGGQFSSYFYGDTNYVSVYGLDPAVEYVVRLLPGMRDIYGNFINDEYAFTFQNGDYRPYSRLALPNDPLTFQFDGQQDIYYEHLNVENEYVAIYPLDLDEVGFIFRESSYEEKFKPRNKPVREWDFAFEGGTNVMDVEQLLLEDDAGNPLGSGYYYITRREKAGSEILQGKLLFIASDNIVLKSAMRDGLAWVTDLKSGTPQSNVPVTFYDVYFNEVGNGRTDDKGTVLLSELDAQPYFALVDDGAHFGFTAIYWGDGARPGSFGISSGYYGEQRDIFAYMYTDRAIYRPGQEVYFKGIVRDDDDLHYSLPTVDEVYVVCRFGDESIFEKYVPISDLGSFTDVLNLSSDAAVGTYTVRALRTKDDDDSIISSVSFRVAEYEKPEFEVNVASDQSEILIGDSANFSLDATYYSGGAVSNAQAQWFIETSDYSFTPSSADYQGYSFTDWERDLYYADETRPSRQTISQGDAEMDANGHVDIEQEFTLTDVTASQRATFSVNVTDVTGNVVSGSTSLVVHQSEYYAGIRSNSYVAVQGEPQDFDVIVLDWDSNPIPDQSVTVSFVERQWFSVQEKDAQGNLTWKSSVKETPAGRQILTTDAEGHATVSFTPTKGGVFKAVVSTKDSKGHTHQASTYFWVASSGYVPWRQTNDRTFSLIPDKDIYSPGDTARLLIAQPFEGEVYALVTYERGHIYKSDVLALDGNSTIYKLPITDEFAPIAYVSVVVISGAEVTGTPTYKVGMATINIDTKQKSLNVDVSVDKKTAGPGDEITYTIKTTDYKGSPVSADVSLAVIDKAVMALTGPNSQPMLTSFYAPRALSVITANGLITNADAYNKEFRESVAEGIISGGGGGDSEGVVTVRENFKDTAVFRAQVVTDDKGEAQVTFTLPENLTTWHADVRAATVDSLVGEGSVEIQTNKPLYVQIQTPRFFIVGDEVQIGAAVHNNTDSALTVEVNLDADGLEITSEKTQRVDVPANQQKYVFWNTNVNMDAERVDITATAVSGSLSDASKPSLGTLPGQGIPVYRYTVSETGGTSGMLTSRGSVTEALLLPDPSTYTNASVDVQISPSLTASIQPSLTYLEDYPYLCMEQTVSRFLPNVITARILKAAGVTNELSANIDGQVNTALQRIYANQYYNGGWSWWSGPDSDPYVSAYVLYGLIEAQKAGYPVSDVVLENGFAYLKDNLKYLTNNDPVWEYNRQAFILYVLADGEKLSPGASQLNFLYQNNDRLSLYGKAYLTQAIHLLDPNDERIPSLLSDLQAAAVLSASGAHWEEDFNDYYNWNTDVRTTAIVLNTYIQVDPENPTTTNAVRWLMANRKGTHWASTQDTAWTLIALVNWLEQQNEFQSQYSFAVGLNGDSIAEGNVDPQHLTETTDLKIGLQELLKQELNYLVVSRGSGEGNLYYTAFLNATLNVQNVQPVEKGIFIKREYYLLDDEKNPVTSADMGDLLHVRLTIVAPSALHYVVVDDPLPAGFEAVDSTLQQDTLVPSTITIAGLKEKGWGWWYFDNIQIQDEKISLSADYLPAGTYVYTYLVRASNLGVFNVIPPSAFEFYFPDVSGHGAGSSFTVK